VQQKEIRRVFVCVHGLKCVRRSAVSFWTVDARLPESAGDVANADVFDEDLRVAGVAKWQTHRT
jgi:hypothetical protein